MSPDATDPVESTDKTTTPRLVSPDTQQVLVEPDALDNLAELVSSFKARVQVLPKPTSPLDLYDFLYSLKIILNSEAKTQMYLEPLGPTATLLQRRISIEFYNVVLTRLPKQFLDSHTLSLYDIYPLMESLREQIPPLYDHRYCNKLSIGMQPRRKRSETMQEYIDRFLLWKERYQPDETPKAVFIWACNIWHDHSNLYDVEPLWSQWISAVLSFRTTEEMVKWFKEQHLLQRPLIGHKKNAKSSSAQGKSQVHRGAAQSQRCSSQSRNNRPVPGSTDRSTQNASHGGVQKNLPAKSLEKGKWKKRNNNYIQSNHNIQTSVG